MTKWRTPEQWALFRATDPDAFNLAVQFDEIQRAGGDPRFIDRTAQPATPAPIAPVVAAQEPPPAPAQDQFLCREERDALIKALSSVIGKYVAESLMPLQAAIDTLDSQIACKADAAQLLNIKAELESRIVAMTINARAMQ